MSILALGSKLHLTQHFTPSKLKILGVLIRAWEGSLRDIYNCNFSAKFFSLLYFSSEDLAGAKPGFYLRERHKERRLFPKGKNEILPTVCKSPVRQYSHLCIYLLVFIIEQQGKDIRTFWRVENMARVCV